MLRPRITYKPNKSNGNISWMITDLPEVGRQQNSPAKSMQAMVYDYDQLNRITAAKSLTAYNPGTGFSQRTNPIEAYDVDYSYDANGNLLTLQRMDEQGALMDDFTYSYYSNSNKLKQTSPVDEDKIYESGAVTSDNKVYRNIFLRGSAYVPSGSTVELKAFEKINMSPDFKVHSGANFKAKIWKEEDGIYQYDAIGNLIADLDEGVKIKWTPYGKVREVQKGDSTTIHFKYDGTGNRIEKSVSDGIDTVITRYIRDASGNVMAIYNDTTMTEQPIYGSSRLGMYRGGDSTGMRTLGHKNYELSNHLGNVLAVATDNIYMNGDSTIASVVSTNDYYPFGLGMAGRSWNDSTYRYGFNGKEKDKNFGQTNYDYGFRIYNPQIAKFLSVDPLTSSYPMLTPYQFASNSPIAGIDLDGLEGRTSTSGLFNGETYSAGSDHVPIVNKPLINQAKPEIKIVNMPQTYLSEDNSSLTFAERQAKVRQYTAEQNYQNLKNDISTISPFVGGGSSNNSFGFASTFKTALEETPPMVFQELLIFKFQKSLKKPFKTYLEFSKMTRGNFKNVNGIHHSTLRSQAFKDYKFNINIFNQNLDAGTNALGNVLDIQGAAFKVDNAINVAETDIGTQDIKEHKFSNSNIPLE